MRHPTIDFGNRPDEAWELDVGHDQPVYDLDLLTKNVFCPTGEGGGIDPTCPAGGSPVMDRKSTQERVKHEILDAASKVTDGDRTIVRPGE